MDASGRKQATFRSPRIAADVALLALLLPIAWGALTFLVLIPLTLILTILEIEVTQGFIWLAGVIAVAVIAVGVRLRLFWTLTLEEGCVAIGTWWPRRVPYSRIVYLGAGAITDPLAAVNETQARVVPLVFGTGLFAQRRIFLPRDEADRCLKMMYARCDNAGAVDTHGRTLPPRNPAAPAAATYRLGETLALRGSAAIALAVVPIAFWFLPHAAGNPRVWRLQMMLLPAVPALLGYGAVCFRRMRKALTGGRAAE